MIALMKISQFIDKWVLDVFLVHFARISQKIRYLRLHQEKDFFTISLMTYLSSILSIPMKRVEKLKVSASSALKVVSIKGNTLTNVIRIINDLHRRDTMVLF